jgi:hypothetical protein
MKTLTGLDMFAGLPSGSGRALVWAFEMPVVAMHIAASRQDTFIVRFIFIA